MRTHHAWALLAAWITAADWWLIQHQQPTMSALARRHPAVTATLAALLTAHLLGSSRYDPLDRIGARLA